MIDLRLGDCLEVMRDLPDTSVDAVITDPPYPEIDRPYGRLTEAEWHDLMHAVVPECRRILKPTGSAVFILQPNSRKIGSMRPWLWEFMAWTCHEWNIVQDFWWHNPQPMPTLHCRHDYGLARPSLKACVWAGSEDCYRDQPAVWVEPAEATKRDKRRGDARLRYHDSTHHGRHSTRIGTCLDRGGATPLNLLWFGRGGGNGHSAATPEPLCDWWVRYISPPGGVVCDPFMGSGTTGLAALKRGRSFLGIERDQEYFQIGQRRLTAAQATTPLFV